MKMKMVMKMMKMMKKMTTKMKMMMKMMMKMTMKMKMKMKMKMTTMMKMTDDNNGSFRGRGFIDLDNGSKTKLIRCNMPHSYTNTS